MSFTNGQVMTVAALGLTVGTLFFSCIGIQTERDYFLMLGLVATTIGDIGFALFLWDSSRDKNDEHATFFCCLAALSIFGIYSQFQKFREDGCGNDDEMDDEDDSQAANTANPATTTAINPATETGEHESSIAPTVRRRRKEK